MWKKQSHKQSFACAWQGAKQTFLEERHFRFHCGFSVFVLLFSWFCKISSMEWVAILFTIALVLGAELTNTAIETLADMITTDYHPLAKKAKDIGAAVVVVCAMFAVLIGCIIFLPRIWFMLMNGY